MSRLQYNLFGNSESSNITVVFTDDNGEVTMLGADNTHPFWDRIVSGATANDYSVVDLFDMNVAANARFEQLSERIAVRNGKVYFDGDEAKGSLADQIVRFLEQGVDDWRPLVNFFEKLQDNKFTDNIEQLYRWLEKQQVAITPEGDFIGYKGVWVDENGDFFSINKGKAIVDDEEFNGYIPNPIGAIVSMPRSAVQHDPAVGCSTGLHVGSWEYANSFAQGAVLEVVVNPRDVVSVPFECSDSKLRTCRYTIRGVTEQENTAAVVYEEDKDDYDYGWGDEEDYNY